MRTGFIVRKVVYLFIRDPEFAAHGSVDILSKLAAIQRRYSAVHQALKALIN
jgi:hypothetical protein